jgi:hypothetical protein
MTLLKSGNSSPQKSRIPEARKNVFLFRVKKDEKQAPNSTGRYFASKRWASASCVK